MPGLYCYWAMKELGGLTRQTKDIVDQGLQQDRALSEILKDCKNRLIRFVMEKPIGRCKIMNFLGHEMEILGVNFERKMWVKRGKPSEYRKALQVLNEFAGLASDLDRSGARFIHELQRAFQYELEKKNEPPKLAQEIWKDPHSIAWHHAMCFWELVVTSVSSFIGIPEAEIEVNNYVEYTFRAWYRGVFSELNFPSLRPEV